MRKAIQFGFSLAASAFAKHPFVGEDSQQDIVQRGDGSIAVKLTQRSSDFDKYKSKEILNYLMLSF